MITIRFEQAPNQIEGNYWGFGDAFGGDLFQDFVAPVPVTASQLSLTDPITGTTLDALGSFVASDAGTAPDLSGWIDAFDLRDGQGTLLFSYEADPPLSVYLLLTATSLTNALKRGDKLIIGTEGDDRVAGNPDDDTVIGAGGDDFLFGNSGNDLLQGGDGDDIVSGHHGDDTLEGGSGNDMYLGSEGIDTARLDGPFANYAVDAFYELEPTRHIVELRDLVERIGETSHMDDVERVEFTDTGFALDVAIGEEAGNALALATAAFGAQAVGDAALLGSLLAQFRDGLAMQAVAQNVIDAYAPPGFTSADLIVHLYATIAGTAPDQATIDFYVGTGLEPSTLYVLAAETAENAALYEAVRLAGFVQYLPESQIS